MSEFTTSPTAASSLAASSSTAPRFLPILVLLFIGSGCAALIYEVVWLQLLQLIIGSTGVSLGVLLGVFMGGMCLGSWLLPRVISDKFHPLVVYAVLEVGIAVCGVVIINAIPFIEGFYTQYGGSGFSGILMRGVVGAVCLLPPTILMGATLPAIARWVETTPTGVSWLGFFYGGNIVGAVAGCMLAGFYLLPEFDMRYATHIAAAINVAVAMLAFLLALFAPHTPPSRTKADGLAERAEGSWAIYVAIGLSGLCALGSEVVWVRLVSLSLGGTVYTFSMILAVFLVGLGIGSTTGAMIARSVASPRVALGICQMLVTAAIAWTSYTVSESLPWWPVDPTINPEDSFKFQVQLDMARTFWAILPGTLLWGASFPLALAAVAGRGQDSGKLVGGVYAANTVGAIFGALLFSMVLIPLLGTTGLGTQHAQRLLIGLAALSSIIVLAPMLASPGASPGTRRETVSPLGVALGLMAVVALAGASLYIVRPVYWGVVAYGRFAPTWNSSLILDEKQKDSEEKDSSKYIEKVYVGEGMNVTVAVTKTTSDGTLSFHGAGKVQASTNPQDMRLQRMLGHLSVLAHKDPSSVKKVLVVACGAGVTAGSFVPYPNIEEIVIVDIEPLVPTRVTPQFHAANHGVLGAKDAAGNYVLDAAGQPIKPNPKVRVIYDDGRHFIRTTKEKFDIITSDPIDPWVKGCAALNTIEYYEMCKQHLNPGGVMSLWIPLYESDLPTIKSVLGTFFTVFPNGILWSNDYGGEGYDAVLFGTVEPTSLDVDKVQDWIDRHYAVKASLAYVNFNSAAELFGTFAGDARNLQTWMQDAQINYDKNLRLQYLAGKAFNHFEGRAILTDILKGFTYPNDIFSGSPETLSDLEDAMRRQNRPVRAGTGAPPPPAPVQGGLNLMDMLNQAPAHTQGPATPEPAATETPAAPPPSQSSPANSSASGN